MGTSEVVADRAVWLARDGASADRAILDLRETSLGRRVAIVMAKQRLEASDQAEGEDVQAAIGLLDLTLKSEDWAT